MEHFYVAKPNQRPSIGHFPNWSLPAFASWSHFDFASNLDQRQMLHKVHSSTWASVHGSTLLIFVPWLLVPCNILNFPNISSSTLEIWFWTRSSDVPVLILLWWIYHCRGGKLINSFYSLVGHIDFPIVHSNALLMEELSLLTPFSKNQPEYIFLRCLQVLENSMKFMSLLFR